LPETVSIEETAVTRSRKVTNATRSVYSKTNRFWNESKQCYERSGSELGFPNELINFLSSRKNGVLAFPIADWREEQGIKTLNDVATCEAHISQLEKAAS